MKKITMLLLLLTPVLLGCGKGHEPGIAEVPRPEIRGVTLEKILSREVESFYETSGSVRAETVSVISSRVMGAVTSVRVQRGDRVRKGDVLMTLDDSDISEKVKAAESAYEEALSGLAMAEENKELVDVTYGRFRQLYEEKALTKQEMDEMETKKRVAESQLRQAEAMARRSEASVREAKAYLAYTFLTSPVDGLVSDKKIDLGTMAAPGVPLIVIEDPSSYAININVDERLFPQIKKGIKVPVKVGSLALDTTGTIAEIAQAVDPVTRTFLVKVAVSGKELRSGFYATVNIPQGTSTLVLVPSAAVMEKGQLNGVYVAGDDRIVHFRLIKTGRKINDMVEVLSGLSGSEMVVTDGVEHAADGGVIVDAQKR